MFYVTSMTSTFKIYKPKMLRFLSFTLIMSHISSYLLQPKYPVKVLNTENIVFSIGNFKDQMDELEIIKDRTDNPELKHQLRKFHMFVKEIEATEKPKVSFVYQTQAVYKPKDKASIYDSAFKTATDRQNLRLLNRRNKIKWKFQKKFIYREVDKRETNTNNYIDTATEYDYLEKEYQDFLDKNQKNDAIFRYSDEGKPEENLKDIILKITDVKTPRNCINFTGISVQAMKCVLKNYKNRQIDKKKMCQKMAKIFFFWLGIYLAVSGLLWCTKGWGCCCFRCAFCFPTKTVKDVQTYIVKNPPGIYFSSEEEHYNPSVREIELYENLKKSISSF